MMKCRMLPAPTHSPPSSYFSPITGLRNEEIHASRCGALVARPSPHAELRSARWAGISTRQLVWLNSQAERMRSARFSAAVWVLLKSRSPVEMWCDSSRVHGTLHIRCRLSGTR